MSDIQADANAFIEAIRAQRNENADASARHFSLYIAEKAKRLELEKEVEKLKSKKGK